jgi:hypothetical protein
MTERREKTKHKEMAKIDEKRRKIGEFNGKPKPSKSFKPKGQRIKVSKEK